MSQLLIKTAIKKESGKLYFVKTSSDGFLEIHEAIAGRPKKDNGSTTSK